MTNSTSHLLQMNVSDLRFVAFDTETTGVSCEKDYILEIAALVFDEDFEQRRFSCLVKPPISIPIGASQIHGIKDEMVKEAPQANEVLNRFFSFLELSGSPRVGLAHNAAFDIGMILSECRRNTDIHFLPEIVLDTCMMAKALLPQLEHHRLSDLAAYFKINSEGFHRAMEDVVVLKEVFLKLLSLAADKAPLSAQGFTLDALINVAGGYYLLQKSVKTSGQKGLGSFFFLPPKLEKLEELCGTDHQIGISYETEEDYRYITPISLKLRAFRVYMEAFCHRDQMKKKFRLDKVLKVGKILSLFLFLHVFFYPIRPAHALNSKIPGTSLYCQGRYQDPECNVWLHFSGCKQQIQIKWTPASMITSDSWIEKNKNYCKVTAFSKTHKTSWMLDANHCESLFRLAFKAIQVFPETDWLAHPCRSSTTVVETSKTALVLKQDHQNFSKAVEIEELLKCDLNLISKKSKQHQLECPVLLYSVRQWLEPFLKIVKTDLVLQNKLR